jgi:uncharacterized protein (TIGR02421 family)
VGTHLVSYFNGSAQTGLAQLRGGLAGYETLQEGLAVLSECLAGGLTRCRARVLAARVLAARWVIRGADFVEVFRRLAHDYAIPRTHAARITLRAFRGGGFIKDAIYLRGFREIMRFLEQGRDLAPLFVGKLALSHLPYIEELRHRAILRPPRLLPRYLQESSPRARLESLRGRDLLEVLTNGPGHGLLS